MKQVKRAVLAPLAIAGLVALAPVAGSILSSPALAQSGTEESDLTLSKKERKQRAKEQRITEYLRKKEEKRARKEAERAAREQQAEQDRLARQQPEERQRPAGEQREAEQRLAAETPSREAPAPATVQTKIEPVSQPTDAPPADAPTVASEVEPTAEKRRKSRRSREVTGRAALPRNLARAQDNVSRSALGRNPTVQRYVSLIDEQAASPQQLAAFGNFLAQNGMPRDAVEYYDVALRLEDDDPVLWVNVGTLHRQLKDLSTAAAAYERALAIDPNYSLAHYNLGVVLDQMGKYNDAVREYKIALSLDPRLGDPTHNPQAANNDRLLAVKVLLYEEQGLGIPLVEIPEGDLPR